MRTYIHNKATWFDFGVEIFKLQNLNNKIVPSNSNDFIQKAKRPNYSVLNDSVIKRSWKEALREYLLN